MHGEYDYQWLGHAKALWFNYGLFQHVALDVLFLAQLLTLCKKNVVCHRWQGGSQHCDCLPSKRGCFNGFH